MSGVWWIGLVMQLTWRCSGPAQALAAELGRWVAMERAEIKQIFAFAGLAFCLATLVFVTVSSAEFFFRVIAGAVAAVVVLPSFILVWIDTGRLFRRLGVLSRRYYWIGQLFGYPQSAFGAVSFLVGLYVLGFGVYGWVTAEPSDGSTGAWLLGSLGFMAFGLALARDAFRPPVEHEEVVSADPD